MNGLRSMSVLEKRHFLPKIRDGVGGYVAEDECLFRARARDLFSER